MTPLLKAVKFALDNPNAAVVFAVDRVMDIRALATLFGKATAYFEPSAPSVTRKREIDRFIRGDAQYFVAAHDTIETGVRLTRMDEKDSYIIHFGGLDPDHLVQLSGRIKGASLIGVIDATEIYPELK